MRPENEAKTKSAHDEDEKLDARLAASLAELPREMEPARDLWQGIAARLPKAPTEPIRADPAIWRGSPASSPWLKLAAASLAGAAIGALLMLLTLGPKELAVADLAQSPETQPTAMAVSAAERPDYRLVEADFLRAREAMWLEVYASSDRFSPDTLAAVEKSFASLDRAIQDLRRALERDPGNPRLEAELYRSHRRSLGLLKKLADHT